VSVDEASARLPSIAESLRSLDPAANDELGLFLWTLRQGTITVPPFLLLGLQACVGLVLLIACANLSAIFLTSWSARQSEIAIRTALGATRPRVIAHLTGEVATVVAVASILGLLLTALLIRVAVLSGLDVGQVTSARTRFEPMVVLFTIGLAVIVTLATGLWPAIRSSGGNLSAILSSGSRRSPRSSRLRRAIVAGQFALSFGVLATTAMLVHLFWVVRNVQGGFDPTGVATFAVTLPEARYQEASARRQFVQSALERLAALPGVQAAAVADRLPRDPRPPSTVPVDIAGNSQDVETPEAVLVGVTEGFTEALRIPLLSGDGMRAVPSDIDEQIANAMQTGDPSRSSLGVLVSRSLAEDLWHGESAVGKTLYLQSVPVRIVGVVGDVVHTFSTLPAHQNPFAVYAPLLAQPPDRVLFVANASGDLGLTMRSVRAVIREVDPEVAVRNLASLEDRISTPLLGYHVYGYAVAGFGLAALFLASLGLYSAMTLSVVERTREIGIRRALGASHQHLMSIIGLVGFRLLVWGSVVGIPLALIGRRAIDELAAGVGQARLSPLIPAFLFLAAVALLSCLPAALAATRLQPTEALRGE
jgi:putative ABC transport system permease protein